MWLQCYLLNFITAAFFFVQTTHITRIATWFINKSIHFCSAGDAIPLICQILWWNFSDHVCSTSHLVRTGQAGMCHHGTDACLDHKALMLPVNKVVFYRPVEYNLSTVWNWVTDSCQWCILKVEVLLYLIYLAIQSKTGMTFKGLPPALIYRGLWKVITLKKEQQKTPHWQMKKCLFEVKKERNVAHHLLDNLHRHQSSRRNRSWALLLILKLIEICCSLEPIHKIHQSHQDKWQLPHL